MFEGWGGGRKQDQDQTFHFRKVWEAQPFLCSWAQAEEEESQKLFYFVAERDRRSPFADWEVNGALFLLVMKLEGLVCYFEMGPSSFSLHWSKLSSRRGWSRAVEHLMFATEDWRTFVHSYEERALFSLLKIRMKTCQEVKKLSSNKKLFSFTQSDLKWVLFLSQRTRQSLLISRWRPQGGPDFSCQGLKFGRAPFLSSWL